MSQNISKLGDITEITPAQDAALATVNPIIGMGLPMAYEHRGDATQFLYNDTNGEADDHRLILNADGTFDSLQRWDGPHWIEADADDDWVDTDGGELCTLVQEALAA